MIIEAGQAEGFADQLLQAPLLMLVLHQHREA